MAAKKNPVNRYPPYLLARQIAALKRLSDDTGKSVMHHIREAVDEYLGTRKRKGKKSGQ
jgi:hypothetical protein